jgi:hypothetical protein
VEGGRRERLYEMHRDLESLGVAERFYVEFFGVVFFGPVFLFT